MKCKEFEKIVILFLYDELDDQEKIEVQQHIDCCAGCHKLFLEYKQLLKSFDVPEDESPPQWEHYWSNIIQKVEPEPARSWLLKPGFKWGLGLAASVLLLVAGLLIGRFVLHTPQSNEFYASAQDSIPVEYVQNYLQDVRPLLVDYLNIPATARSEENGLIEKEVVKSLLMQSRLLRKRFPQGQDPYLDTLLGELEMILVEIKNLLPGDTDSRQGLQQAIRERGIPLKIQIYKLQPPREEKI